MVDKGLIGASKSNQVDGNNDSIVLDKSIFSNVFKKDIRRVYVYKKAERIAKALHLISPAFKDNKVLRERLQRLSVELIDASTLPFPDVKEALSRDLLSLSSLLALSRAAGLLSPMNSGLIQEEAHRLLQEVASYEEPKVMLPETESLAALIRSEAGRLNVVPKERSLRSIGTSDSIGHNKGHISDTENKSDRKNSILSMLGEKGPSYIKDLSLNFRDVSEKTIQRELQSLVLAGKVLKEGKRRWTTYRIADGVSKTNVVDSKAISR